MADEIVKSAPVSFHGEHSSSCHDNHAEPIVTAVSIQGTDTGFDRAGVTHGRTSSMDEFSGMIADTEASMRGKLSELNMLESDIECAENTTFPSSLHTDQATGKGGVTKIDELADQADNSNCPAITHKIENKNTKIDHESFGENSLSQTSLKVEGLKVIEKESEKVTVVEIERHDIGNVDKFSEVNNKTDDKMEPAEDKIKPVQGTQQSVGPADIQENKDRVDPSGSVTNIELKKVQTINENAYIPVVTVRKVVEENNPHVGPTPNVSDNVKVTGDTKTNKIETNSCRIETNDVDSGKSSVTANMHKQPCVSEEKETVSDSGGQESTNKTDLQTNDQLPIENEQKSSNIGQKSDTVDNKTCTKVSDQSLVNSQPVVSACAPIEADSDDDDESPSLVIDEGDLHQDETKQANPTVDKEEEMEYEIHENTDSNQSSDGLVISNVISLSALNQESENLLKELEAGEVDAAQQVKSNDASIGKCVDELKAKQLDGGTGHMSQNGKTEGKKSKGSRRKRKQSAPSVRKVTDIDVGVTVANDQSVVPDDGMDNLTFIVHKSSAANSNTDDSIVVSDLSTGQDSGTHGAVSGPRSSPLVTEESQEGQLPIIANIFSMQGIEHDGAAFPDALAPEIVGLNTNTTTTTGVGNIDPIGSGQTVYKSMHTGRKVTPPLAPAQKLVMSKIINTTMNSRLPVNPGTAVVTRLPVTLVPAHSSNKAPGLKTVPFQMVNGVSLPATSAINLTVSPSAKNSSGKNSKESTVNDMAKTLQKLSSINIQSVGVARITDLIARKNPIPTYKPKTNQLVDGKTYPCYECGDTFLLKNSFDIHFGRCSMKLHYKCEKCLKFLQFTNKCQLLNHLRSHMNIAKTQAVPIHIKSDSIEITSYYNDIDNDKAFDWYKVTSPLPSESTCMVCNVFKYKTVAERKKHFNNPDAKQKFPCDQCTCEMTTKCSLQAHQWLHKLVELNKKGATHLSNPENNFVHKMVCPECGFHVEQQPGQKQSTTMTSILQLLSHILQKCFHFQGIHETRYHCSKCSMVETGRDKIACHLYGELEHYYKCEKCPMALKSVRNLQAHFHAKHMAEPKLLAKLIYRCHICSTLIDDKSFLLQHMNAHIDTFKKEDMDHYFCFTCGLISPTFQDLKSHMEASHKNSKPHMLSYCNLCRAHFGNCIHVVDHFFIKHLNLRPANGTSNSKFCEHCSLLCPNPTVLIRHQCIARLNQTKVVGDMPDDEMKCKMCDFKFQNHQQKLQHMKLHTEKQSYMCEYCGKANFCSNYDFKSHKIYCAAVQKQAESKQTEDLKIKQSKLGQASGKKRKSESPGKKFRGAGTSLLQVKDELESSEEESSGEESEIKLTPVTEKTKKRSKQPDHSALSYFPCDKCSDSFLRKSKLEAHMNAEHGLHPCHLCGVMHNSGTSLKRHLAVEHEGKRFHYFCLMCRKRNVEKSFTQQSKLAKHLKLKHRMKNVDSSKFVAELPGFRGITEKELTPDDQSWPSPESNASEPPVKKLRIQGENTFKCAKCLFTCEEKKKFTEHIVEHKTPNTFQCLECGLCFSVLPSLSKHLFMVHKIREFDKYIEENNIENPADNIDSEDDIERENDEVVWSEDSELEEEEKNPLECKVCYRQFDSEKQMQGHMRVHGMAFIKKSRRRSLGVSTNKKPRLEEEGDGRTCERVGQGSKSLVLKIKIAKIDAVQKEDEQMAVSKVESDKQTEGANLLIKDNGEDDVTQAEGDTGGENTLTKHGAELQNTLVKGDTDGESTRVNGVTDNVHDKQTVTQTEEMEIRTELNKT